MESATQLPLSLTATLRPHQEKHVDALEYVVRRRAAALDASDTGTGKTYTALALAKRLGVSPFVLCPKSVVATWRDVGRQLGVDVTALNYEKARGGSKKVGGRRLFQSELGEEIPCGTGSQWRWKRPVEFAVFDEVHRCGGMTSLHSKMLIAARRQFGKVLVLSATAADDPVRMKALGFTLGLFQLPQFKWWMLANGVQPKHWGGFEFTRNEAKRQQVMLDLHAHLFPHRGARMRKSEIPGFPETVVEPKLLDDPGGRADELCREILDLYLLRERQAAAAAESDGLEEPRRHLEQLLRKRQALELLKVPDMVELALDYSQTSKVVLFAHYRDTLDALRQELESEFKAGVPIIDGSNTAKDRAAIQQAFQANEIPVLLCNAEAGGVALSLHDPAGRVERTALISPGWSARQFKQMLGRVHRDGGAFSQQFVVGFAGTLEEQIVRTLAGRCNCIDLLNDGVMHGLLK